MDRSLFLIPAHNEQLHIGVCVQSVKRALVCGSGSRILVVADNCTDETVTVARAAGSEVIERNDTANRGKPRAIAWALERVDLTLFEAIVIIDADTIVDAQFVRSLLEWTPLASKVIQTYLGSSNEYETWLTRLAGVLTRGRYEVNYPLRQHCGLNVPLTGNGMCIGTDILRHDGWQAFSLTEDLELYARWTAQGIRIHYAPRARLYSQEARSLHQSDTQRARWAVGRLTVLRSYASQLIISCHIGPLQKLDALLELTLPGPVIQLALSLMLAATAFLLAPAGARPWLVAIVLSPMIPHVVTTAVVVARHPQPWQTLAAFVRLPIYMAWRVLLSARTMAFGVTEWRRTDRY